MSDMHFREPNQVKWMGTRPGHNGVQVLASGPATDATVIIYTVPAGQRFYLCGWQMINWGTVYGDGAFLYIYTAVPAIHRELARGINAVQIPLVICRDLVYPIEIAANYSVRLFSNAATCIANVDINGWTE